MSRNRDVGRDGSEAGRLTARPLARPADDPGRERGVRSLGLDAARDAMLFVPTGYRADRRAPLAVMLHGAAGNARHGLSPLLELADASGLVLLAPQSRDVTWDQLLGGFGPDVQRLDRALAWTFARFAIDSARIALGGFSDGASYALSLGLGNGDLFRQIIAFSPGFAAPAQHVGTPRIYLSHGTGDRILPIDSCSRRIVPMLRAAGYDVRYDEFDGPHVVPDEIARAALEWLLAGRAPPSPS